MDRIDDFIQKHRVVMWKRDIEPLDRFNDPLLLLGREMKAGACHVE